MRSGPPESATSPDAHESAHTPQVLLEVASVSKAYGAIQALEEVSFEIGPGEVVGLVGDNGAGKSTLVRCIAGVLRPDDGTILAHGKSYESGVDAARDLGIEAVHQDLGLIDSLNVDENFFLNREPLHRLAMLRSLGWIDRRKMRQETEAAFAEFGVDVGAIDRPIAELSGGQRQIVAVIRSVNSGPSLIMMDEPTAALGVEQAELVLNLIRDLGKSGISVIFVSHNMQHVAAVCGRILVLRRGRKVADLQTEETDPNQVVGYITGAVDSQVRGEM